MRRRKLRGWQAKNDLTVRDWEGRRFHTHTHAPCGRAVASAAGDGGHTHYCTCDYMVPVDHHGFPWDEMAHGKMARY